MKNFATRLVLAAGIVAAIFAGGTLVEAFMRVPEVALPPWDFRALPLQLGPWQGRAAELDPRIYRAIGAAKDKNEQDMVVDRVYRDESSRAIALHTAMFDRPDDGIYHSPINCYRGQGYEKLREVTDWAISADEDTPARVNYSIWEKGGKRKIVVYWFQLGDRLVFDRSQMAWAHWRLRGETTWPVLIKVLIDTDATDDREQDDDRVRDFARRVHGWIEEQHAATLPEAAGDGEGK